MNAHRLIAKNENGYLHIILPDEIRSKEVEVFLVPVAIDKEERKKIIDGLWGSVKFEKSIDEVDEEIRKMRDEWERDI